MMPFTRRVDPGLARFVVSTCRGVTVVAAAFSIAVAAILAANYVQLATLKPLDNPALATLRERYRSSPNDTALAEDIRALDLAGRRVYFTRQWQSRTGAWMLVAGAAVLLASLRAAGSFARRLPQPRPDSMEGAMSSKSVRLTLASMGVVLLGGGMAAAVLMAEPRAVTPSTAAPSPASSPAVAIPPEIYENWPQFRGPGGNGIASWENPPLEWDGKSGANVRWSVPVPLPGRSSPVAWGDRVYLSGADKTTREVYCWSIATGALLWRLSVPLAAGAPAWPPGKVDASVGYAASTMVVDASAAYVMFANGDITAIDPKGTILWARHLGDPKKNYGYASSLALCAGAVIVQFDQEEGGALFALKEGDGTTLWETAREVTSSWTTPTVVNTGTRAEILVQGNPILASYDPATGKELWHSEPVMMGEIGPSPAYDAGRVIAANQLLALSAIDARNGATLWEVFEDFPDVASPLAAGGMVVAATSYGVVTCLDAATGEVIWKKEFDTGFYASPILAGNRFYLLDRGGVMRIFAADRTMKLIGSPAIGEPEGERVEATPAFHAGAILIRSASRLYCIGVKGG
jgi:outer membrane protein assembly factor BamB